MEDTSLGTYNVLFGGAQGNGNTDDAVAIQGILDRIEEEGGGTILFPSGRTFLSGPLRFGSNTRVVVEQGAVLRAVPEIECYRQPAFPGNSEEGTVWLHAENAENVELCGGGLVDGNGPHFLGTELKTSFAFREQGGIDRRPHLLTMVGCTNLRVRDLTFKDSAYWCLHFAGCVGVDIRGIRIDNNTKIRNGDGIDVDHTRNVHIEGCTISSGDDSICLKTRREFDGHGPTENVTVSNCHLTSTSCAVKLGSENTESIRNVVVNNCTVTGSNRGIAVQNRDEGAVENVLFANIVIETRLFGDEWWGRAEPIYVTALERGEDEVRRFPPGEARRAVGAVRNIRFSNLICRGENGAYVSGCEESRPSGIVFDNVAIEIEKTTSYPGGSYDRRPTENEPLEHAPTAGIFLRSADDVALHGCRVYWHGKQLPDYYGPAIRGIEVRGLEIRDFAGGPARPESGGAILIEECTGVTGGTSSQDSQ